MSAPERDKIFLNPDDNLEIGRIVRRLGYDVRERPYNLGERIQRMFKHPKQELDNILRSKPVTEAAQLTRFLPH